MRKERLDFSENKNAYMPSKEILIAYREAIKQIHRYPDYKNIGVNNAIADFFNIASDEVTVTNGSMEGINLLSRIALGRKASLFVPTFWGYQDAFKRYGYDIESTCLLNNLEYELDKIMLKARNADIMFICNPNNPTLSYIEKDKLLQIIISNPQCHFVIDETMLMFAPDFEDKSLTKEIKDLKNVSVIISFSKIFGLAGIRTGALVSNPEMISRIKQEIVPYSIGSIIQAVLPVALNNKEFLNETKRRIAINRQELCQSLQSMGDYEIISGVTNFILVKLPEGLDATKLTDYLLQENMVVRNINEAYPLLLGEWIRISINTQENNRKLLQKIGNYQKTKKY